MKCFGVFFCKDGKTAFAYFTITILNNPNLGYIWAFHLAVVFPVSGCLGNVVHRKTRGALRRCTVEVCGSMAGLELLSDQGYRLDGRKATELRKVQARMGVFAQADGSAYLEQGNTKALAVVYGPHEVSRGEGW